MSHPESYIAYRFEGVGGELKRAVIPWHEPKDGEVIVKVLACGVCARLVLYWSGPTCEWLLTPS